MGICRGERASGIAGEPLDAWAGEDSMAFSSIVSANSGRVAEIRTIRCGLRTAMLLAPHLDHHLPQAGHNGCRAKVPEVGHPVAGAQAQAPAARIVFKLRRGRQKAGVRSMRHGGHGGGAMLQERPCELGIDGGLDSGGRRVGAVGDITCTPRGPPRIFGRLGRCIVVSITGAFMFVLDARLAEWPFAWISC